MPEIARIRTISGCVEELKKLDPHTQVSRNFVRNLVLSGKVKFVRAGSKYLVQFDDLLRYLNSPDVERNEFAEYGKIRPIKVSR